MWEVLESSSAQFYASMEECGYIFRVLFPHVFGLAGLFLFGWFFVGLVCLLIQKIRDRIRLLRLLWKSRRRKREEKED